MKPFTTDGCSGGMSVLWRLFTGHNPPWQDLCVEHDRAYWMGGTWEMRWDADSRLRNGIIARGYLFWGLAVFLGVRLGGVSWLPTSWRWGYGHRWPRSGP